MRNIMKEAHKMAKEITTKYNDVDYKVQLGLCISYLFSKEEEVEMVELKGTEKQVKWANDLRSELVRRIEEKKEEVLASIVGDKVKSSGKVLTEADRKAIRAKRFDNALEFILNQEESEFFIKYFKNIHNWSNWDMWRNLQDDYFRNTKMEALDRIASSWQ